MVAHDCHERRVRMYPYLAENTWAVYNALRKRQAAGWDGTVTKRQLARDLYPDVAEDPELAEQKENSVRRWLRLLERQGLIRTEVLTKGSGKSIGLRVQLLAVEEVPALRGCSSAGSRVRIKLRRTTAEERCEARVRPWNPRAGRGAPSRWDWASPFFSPLRVVPPRGKGGRPLRGLPLLSINSRRGAREGLLSDAHPPPWEDSLGAAQERELLWRAEQAFVRVLGEPEQGRLSSLQPIRRLLRAFRRLDRYGNFGQGRAGSGLDVLERELEGALWDHQHRVAAYAPPLPRHLGYFVPALAAEARRWKHTWAPRIKAERRERAAGQPPSPDDAAGGAELGRGTS